MDAELVPFRKFLSYGIQFFMQQPDFENNGRRSVGGGGVIVSDFVM